MSFSMREEQTISIATLNTWKCDGEYHTRRQLMAEQLASTDVILLQEVFKTESIDTAEFLADVLALSCLHQPARHKRREFEGEMTASTSGLAILSKWPISSIASLSLPSPNQDGERIAQIAKCESPLGPLAIVNTHLTHLSDADGIRKSQLQTIIRELQRRKLSTVVLGGDLNAEPDSTAIGYLAHQHDYFLDDAADRCGNPFSTLVNSTRRIDYVFLLQKVREFEFASVSRTADVQCPNTGQFPSDHFGVRAIVRNLDAAI